MVHLDFECEQKMICVCVCGVIKYTNSASTKVRTVGVIICDPYPLIIFVIHKDIATGSLEETERERRDEE